ncbi:MAG TPA: pyridoxal phosphate-dependent aminotransferase, partial [Eubacteriaceae bacterium]|nr:pyridoxal phosphate-dependent aminotransferase [Eubacteriaceae bacterium]
MEGTYLQWIDFRKWKLSEKELEEKMQKEARMFLDEGYIFGEAGKGFERINLACPKETLMEGLERIKKAF